MSTTWSGPAHEHDHSIRTTLPAWTSGPVLEYRECACGHRIPPPSLRSPCPGSATTASSGSAHACCSPNRRHSEQPVRQAAGHHRPLRPVRDTDHPVRDARPPPLRRLSARRRMARRARPDPTAPETEPAMDTGQDHTLEPVPLAEVIQAFAEYPELFTAAAVPDPPEAA